MIADSLNVKHPLRRIDMKTLERELKKLGFLNKKLAKEREEEKIREESRPYIIFVE